jgi:hypothetical protein
MNSESGAKKCGAQKQQGTLDIRALLRLGRECYWAAASTYRRGYDGGCLPAGNRLHLHRR